MKKGLGWGKQFAGQWFVWCYGASAGGKKMARCKIAEHYCAERERIAKMSDKEELVIA